MRQLSDETRLRRQGLAVPGDLDSVRNRSRAGFGGPAPDRFGGRHDRAIGADGPRSAERDDRGDSAGSRHRRRLLRPDPQAARHDRVGIDIRSGESPSECRAWSSAARSAGRAGSSSGNRSRPARSAATPSSLVELHVDLDRGPAGDGGGDIAPDVVERQAPQLALGDLQDFEQDLLDLGRSDAGGRGLDRDGADCRTARSRSPSAFSSSAMRAYWICCAGGELQDHRHQQLLALDTRPVCRCFSTCSNRMRSCATCWSMIHSPSLPAAMMKLS